MNQNLENAFNPNPSKEVPKKKKEPKREDGKKRITWIGTSVSNVMDKKKFEKDCNVKLKMVKAYCIDKEEKALYKEVNFRTVVPTVIAEQETDILVVQTGSIEITDMDINKVLKDVPEKLGDYKKKWFQKVEKDSTTLFEVAEAALAKDDALEKVVIVKRLPRFDKGPKTTVKIKKDLSEFGNSVYDQLWLKRGRPEKIHIVELDLKCTESEYLKRIIFGNPGQLQFDGVHLRGSDSGRHFTYRAVQSLKPILKQAKSAKPNYETNCGNDCPQQRFQRKQNNQSPPDAIANPRANQSPVFDNQTWQFPRTHLNDEDLDTSIKPTRPPKRVGSDSDEEGRLIGGGFVALTGGFVKFSILKYAKPVPDDYEPRYLDTLSFIPPPEDFVLPKWAGPVDNGEEDIEDEENEDEAESTLTRPVKPTSPSRASKPASPAKPTRPPKRVGSDSDEEGRPRIEIGGGFVALNGGFVKFSILKYAKTVPDDYEPRDLDNLSFIPPPEDFVLPKVAGPVNNWEEEEDIEDEENEDEAESTLTRPVKPTSPSRASKPASPAKPTRPPKRVGSDSDEEGQPRIEIGGGFVALNGGFVKFLILKLSSD